MKARIVGLRIALFGFLALALGTAMGMSGEAGSFAPAEVLAGETGGVPTAANPAHVAARVSGVGPVRNAGLRATLPAARVSPFFATPALSALRRDPVEADCGEASSPEELFRFENYSDTEWWIYTGIFGWESSSPTPYPGVWNCLKWLAADVNGSEISWFWWLFESDGQTPLLFCSANDIPVPEDVYYSFPYGGGCAVNYWDYFEEYDCVGDETFVLYYQIDSGAWVGPLINDDGPYYGCAGS